MGMREAGCMAISGILFMNYDAFMEPLTWFFTGMEKHSDDYQQGMLGNADSFRGAMVYHMASFLGPSLQVAMNELSNSRSFPLSDAYESSRRTCGASWQ